MPRRDLDVNDGNGPRPGGPPVARVLAEGRGWQIGEYVCRSGPEDRPFEERHEFFSIAAVGNGQWLQKSPEAARAVVKAIWRGARALHKEPEQAKEAVRKQFATLPQPLFDRAYAINAKAFRDNPDFTRAQIEQNIELQGSVTGQPIKVDVDKIFTRSIIEAVAPSMR